MERLGFEPAATMERALDLAREGQAGAMSLTCPMVPPAFVCKVEHRKGA